MSEPPRAPVEWFSLVGVRSMAANMRLFERGKLLGSFAMAQVAVQMLSFFSGILLIRTLSKEQYALFTIANTMQAMMTMLADNGISSGLSAIGGGLCEDRVRFGSLINSAMRLRRLLAVISVTAIFPVLAWMLARNHARTVDFILIFTGVALAVSFQLPVGVLSIVPRLLLQTRRLQQLDLSSAAVRLLILLIAWKVWLNAGVAVVVGAAALSLQYVSLLRWTRSNVDLSTPPNLEFQRGILAVIKRQAPNTIYFCFQSQIGIWLVSAFGSTTTVAEVGALGRLGMIFSIIAAVLTSVVLPRFARYRETALIWRRYAQITAGYVLFGSLLVLAALLFPRPLLAILGPQYANLEGEIGFLMVNAVLGSILGALYALNASRAWILPPVVAIPAGLVTQVSLMLLLDISTVRGVLLLGIIANAIGIILNLWMARASIRNLRTPVGQAQGNAVPMAGRSPE